MPAHRPLAVLLLMALARLAGAADTPPAGLVVHNKGIGGQNSAQGRARFDRDVLALKPDHVFIYFGLNDTLNEPRFLTVEQFVENLAWMVEQARRNKIHPVLCTIHPIGEEPLYKRHKRESYGKEGPNGKVGRYNAAVRELAKARDVPLADWAAEVARANAAGEKLVGADGVHLTVEGSRRLARCFRDAARDLKPGQTVVCIGDSVTWGAGMKGAGTADGQTYPAVLKELAAAKQ